MEKQEFPKMVYGPNGATKIINSMDEKPDGYLTIQEKRRGSYSDESASAAAGAVQAAEIAASKKAAEDADAARAAAAAAAEKAAAAAEAEKAAIEERRTEIKAFLDTHNVDYKPQLGLAKLEELEAELKAHLAATSTETANDNSE